MRKDPPLWGKQRRRLVHARRGSPGPGPGSLVLGPVSGPAPEAGPTRTAGPGADLAAPATRPGRVRKNGAF